MSASIQRPPDAEANALAPGGLSPSTPPIPCAGDSEAEPVLLGSLPVGARLILRCRKDWRAAAVSAREPDTGRIVLSVASPTGHTYRVRRPADSHLSNEGPLPILGTGTWRACFARYDLRW